MFLGMGPAFWEGVKLDIIRSERIRKELSSKQDQYLESLLDMGVGRRAYLIARQAFAIINPLNYGSGVTYEPAKRYEVARDILAERNLEWRSDQTLKEVIEGVGILEDIGADIRTMFGFPRSERVVMKEAAESMLRERRKDKEK